MSDSAITLIELEAICHQATAVAKADGMSFKPTPNQVYFFTLVWLLKQKGRWQQVEELLVGQEATALAERAQVVTYHLREWGVTITQLKAGDERAWKLLCLQIEKVVQYYPCSSKEAKAEAEQKALIKVFELLRKMLSWPELEEVEVANQVLNTRTILTNIYDFGSPFYAFAKRIARNELINQLRHENRHSGYFTPLDDRASSGPVPLFSLLVGDDEGLKQTFRWQLKSDMTKLLDLIQHSLTPRPLQVILQTLETREGFWRALEFANLTTPADLSPTYGLSTDADIAQTLGITENNVRVHRANAKNRVNDLDPLLGRLLESLISRRGSITYRPVTDTVYMNEIY